MTNFEKLVKKMREAQKAYFKATHGTDFKREWLLESKALEKEVDCALSRMESQEGSLF